MRDNNIISLQAIRRSFLLLILVLFVNLYQAYITKEPILVGNEWSHVKLLTAIVDHETFIIDPTPADKSFYKGQYYSNEPPGFSIALSPFYLIYKKTLSFADPFNVNKYLKVKGRSPLEYDLFEALFFTKTLNALFSAIVVGLLFLLLSTYNISGGAILFGVVAATAGTFFPAYSILANSIPFSYLLLILAILFFRLHQLDEKKIVYWYLSLFVSSCILIVDYNNAFVIFPLLAFLTLKARHGWAYLGGIIPLLLPPAIHCLYTYTLFDDPFVFTYSFFKAPDYVQWKGIEDSISIANIPAGLHGMLISPARGIFALSPVLILGAIGSVLAIKKGGRELLIPLAMAVSGFFIIAASAHWHGGHAVGYRHGLMSAMIFGLLSAFYFNGASLIKKMVALILLLISIVTGVASFFIERDKELLAHTWKGEPDYYDHANYYTELLIPYINKYKEKRLISDDAVFGLTPNLDEKRNYNEAMFNTYLGYVNYDKGYINLAVDYLAKAISLRPDLLNSRYLMATIHHKRGSLKEARREYEAILKIRPDYGGALTGLASLHYSRGNIKGAVSRYREAIDFGKGLQEEELSLLHYNLAEAYESLGDGSKALKEYKAFAATASAGRAENQKLLEDARKRIEVLGKEIKKGNNQRGAQGK